MPNNTSASEGDRRVGPSRLSTWSGGRVGAFWLLWPGIIIAICVSAVFLSVYVQHGFSEVRSDLTRANLIGLTVVLINRPTCPTVLWWRMRGRRRVRRAARSSL